MGLFTTRDMSITLHSLDIEVAEDRVGGVEPYVIPVFFKVDGERYIATLRILNSRNPVGGVSEALIQFAVETLANGPLADGEAPVINQKHNPKVWVPPGNLLDRGGFESGSRVDLRDINYRAGLVPIPFRIDVLGLKDVNSEAIRKLIVKLGFLDAFNTILVALDVFVADLFGLDEAVESCPDLEELSGNFLNDIDAQFRCLMPGTFGAVFVCLENDAFDEDTAQDLRSSVKNEIGAIINNVIDSIALNNPIPDPELFQDPEVIRTHIQSEVTLSVLADLGMSLGPLVVNHLTGSTLFGVQGILNVLSWATGGLDEIMGQFTIAKSHLDFGVWPSGTRIPFHVEMPDVDVPDDANKWKLTGYVTLH